MRPWFLFRAPGRRQWVFPRWFFELHSLLMRLTSEFDVIESDVSQVPISAEIELWWILYYIYIYIRCRCHGFFVFLRHLGGWSCLSGLVSGVEASSNPLYLLIYIYIYMLRRKYIIWRFYIIAGESTKSPDILANVFNQVLIPYIHRRMYIIAVVHGECD